MKGRRATRQFRKANLVKNTKLGSSEKLCRNFRSTALVELGRAYRACAELYRAASAAGVLDLLWGLAATKFVNDLNDKPTCASKQPATNRTYASH